MIFRCLHVTSKYDPPRPILPRAAVVADHSHYQEFAGRHGDPWSPEEDSGLTSLKAAGFGAKRIAAHFPGRTIDAIKSRWRELDGRGRSTRAPSRRDRRKNATDNR